MQFGDEASFVRDKLVRALTEPWGRPSELAETSALLIKFNPIAVHAEHRIEIDHRTLVHVMRGYEVSEA